MTEVYKPLGQQVSTADTAKVLYRVPSGVSTSISSMSIVNTGSECSYSVNAISNEDFYETTALAGKEWFLDSSFQTNTVGLEYGIEKVKFSTDGTIAVALGNTSPWPGYRFLRYEKTPTQTWELVGSFDYPYEAQVVDFDISGDASVLATATYQLEGHDGAVFQFDGINYVERTQLLNSKTAVVVSTDGQYVGCSESSYSGGFYYRGLVRVAKISYDESGVISPPYGYAYAVNDVWSLSGPAEYARIGENIAISSNGGHFAFTSRSDISGNPGPRVITFCSWNKSNQNPQFVDPIDPNAWGQYGWTAAPSTVDGSGLIGLKFSSDGTRLISSNFYASDNTYVNPMSAEMSFGIYQFNTSGLMEAWDWYPIAENVLINNPEFSNCAEGIKVDMSQDGTKVLAGAIVRNVYSEDGLSIVGSLGAGEEYGLFKVFSVSNAGIEQVGEDLKIVRERISRDVQLVENGEKFAFSNRVVYTGQENSVSLIYRLEDVVVGGVLTPSKTFLIKDKTISSGVHDEIVGGIQLSAGDAIAISATSSDVVFNLFGVEIS